MTPYWQGSGITLYHADSIEYSFLWAGSDFLITDPPYGIGFTSGYVSSRPIRGDGSVAVRDMALAIWGGRPAAVFGSWKAPRPPHITNLLIWDKSDATGPGMGDLSQAFGRSHEEIYLLGYWPKQGRRQPSVLRTREGMCGRYGVIAKAGHPAAKPLSLMQRIIENTPPGVISDPFAGTSATLIAAMTLGREAIGVEIEEQYCEKSAIRLEQADSQLRMEL